MPAGLSSSHTTIPYRLAKRRLSTNAHRGFTTAASLESADCIVLPLMYQPPLSSVLFTVPGWPAWGVIWYSISLVMTMGIQY